MSLWSWMLTLVTSAVWLVVIFLLLRLPALRRDRRDLAGYFAAPRLELFDALTPSEYNPEGQRLHRVLLLLGPFAALLFLITFWQLVVNRIA